MTNKIKLALAALLLVAGVIGFYYFANSALVLRIIIVLAGLVSATFVALQTPIGQDAVAFARDSIKETKLVVWPTKQETIQTTVAVFLLVLVMGIFLMLVDVGFSKLVQLLMDRGA